MIENNLPWGFDYLYIMGVLIIQHQPCTYYVMSASIEGSHKIIMNLDTIIYDTFADNRENTLSVFTATFYSVFSDITWSTGACDHRIEVE